MPYPKNQQLSRPHTAAWTLWAILAAGAFIPLAISHLPLPHPATPPLQPQALANLAYGLGIALAAAALLLHHHADRYASAQAPAHYVRTLLISAVLAQSIAWLGFAAWLADVRTPALYTLLAISAAVFWLIRPHQPTPNGTRP